jgi:hypothetical protein
MLRFLTKSEAILVKEQIGDQLLGKFGIVSVSMKKSDDMFCIEVGVEKPEHLESMEQVFKDHNISLGLKSAKSPFIVIGKIEAQLS